MTETRSDGIHVLEDGNFLVVKDGQEIESGSDDLAYLARSFGDRVAALIFYPDGRRESVARFLQKEERRQERDQVVRTLEAKVFEPQVGNTNLKLGKIREDVQSGELVEGVYQQLDRNVIITKQGVYVLNYAGYSTSERAACISFAKNRLGLDLRVVGQLPNEYWDVNRTELPSEYIKKFLGV